MGGRDAINYGVMKLTPMEDKVFSMLTRGGPVRMTSKVIARELGLSPKTIDKHRANLYEKLGVHSLVELMHAVPEDDAKTILLKLQEEVKQLQATIGALVALYA